MANSARRTPAARIAVRLFLLGMLLAGALAGGVPVSAASPSIWELQDSFENTATWTFDGSSPVAGSFPTGVARTGARNARLETTANTWKSVGRTVRIAPAADQWDWPIGGTCAAQFYFRSYTGALTARIEVIDPATWTYLSLRDVSISQGGYAQVFGGSWSAKAKPEVFVRATIHGPSGEIAYVDDLKATCTENIIH